MTANSCIKSASIGAQLSEVSVSISYGKTLHIFFLHLKNYIPVFVSLFKRCLTF